MSTKKKAAPKKKEPTITIKEYGNTAVTTGLLGGLSTWYGEQIPDDLEGQVKFWKQKYESQKIETAIASAKVTLLERIVKQALMSGGSRD